MVSTTILYENSETTPPVFVAGSFTDWKPVELDSNANHESASSKFSFAKTFNLSVGEHQYKFRIGHGDWWVCDGSKPMGNDGSGNTNNILTVSEGVEPKANGGNQFTIDGAYDSDDEPTQVTLKELNGASEDFEADNITSRAMRAAEDDPPVRDLGAKFNKDLHLSNGTADVKKSTMSANIREKPGQVNGEQGVKMVGGLDGTAEGSESYKMTSKPHVERSEYVDGSDCFGRDASPSTEPTKSIPQKQSLPRDDSGTVKFPDFDDNNSTTGSGNNNHAAPAPTTAEIEPQAASATNNQEHQSAQKTPWYAKLCLCGTRNNMVLAGVMIMPVLISWILYYG